MYKTNFQQKDNSIHYTHLAFGNSPSSFLHLTVGTGSPLASHLNSALSSTVTAKLLGLFTKDGLSKREKNKNRISPAVLCLNCETVIFPKFHLLEQWEQWDESNRADSTTVPLPSSPTIGSQPVDKTCSHVDS